MHYLIVKDLNDVDCIPYHRCNPIDIDKHPWIIAELSALKDDLNKLILETIVKYNTTYTIMKIDTIDLNHETHLKLYLILLYISWEYDMLNHNIYKYIFVKKNDRIFMKKFLTIYEDVILEWSLYVCDYPHLISPSNYLTNHTHRICPSEIDGYSKFDDKNLYLILFTVIVRENILKGGIADFVDNYFEEMVNLLNTLEDKQKILEYLKKNHLRYWEILKD